MKRLFMSLKTGVVAASIAAAGLFSSAPAQAQDGMFIGQVSYWAGNFAPRSWAFCDGQLLSIASNSALFSILGTTYGGDGRSTFGLPDARGRTIIHPGDGPGLSRRVLGEKLGQEYSIYLLNQLASHNHTGAMKASTGAASGGTPTVLGTGGTAFIGRSGTIDVTMSAGTAQINNTGGGQDMNNMQPSLATNCIISLFGVYPSRS